MGLSALIFQTYIYILHAASLRMRTANWDSENSVIDNLFWISAINSHNMIAQRHALDVVFMVNFPTFKKNWLFIGISTRQCVFCCEVLFGVEAVFTVAWWTEFSFMSGILMIKLSSWNQLWILWCDASRAGHWWHCHLYKRHIVVYLNKTSLEPTLFW